MNNNIEFSIVPNKTNTKFKIAWTVNLGDYPMTKVMPREFESEEATQEYIDKNKEVLAQKIRERISKIAINLKEIDVEPTIEVQEETTEEVKTEEVVEETSEELTDEEVIDELATELPETEEVAEEIESEEQETSEEVEETSEELTDEEVTENTEVTALVPVEQDEEEVAVVRKPNRKLKIARRVIAAIIALALAIGVAHLIKSCDKEDAPLGTVPGTESTDTPETNEPDEENTLTIEEFENLVAQLTKALKDKNVNLTTEEITKFVAIINIDSLAEENPELAKELFKDSTKEEYIQEAAKTISETVMYNARVFEAEKSTENFVRISNALYGEGKEQLAIIETYVDEIAKVYYDAEQVNILVSDLITRLATGDLQTLDNGAQFGMQVSIELIRSYIAKDVLSKVNSDVLTDITRLDVSGIMSTYDNVNGLNGNTKTLK